MISFTLKNIPLSVNQLYSNIPKVGRVKTSAYRAWEKAASMEIMAQRAEWPVKSIQGEYILRLDVPYNKRRDLGNYEKSLSDLLQSMDIIENDSLCVEMHLSKIPGSHAVITIDKSTTQFLTTKERTNNVTGK